MEYALHIWDGSTHTDLFEKVKSRAFRLINSPTLTNSLQSLSPCRIVVSVSQYYHCSNLDCSSEFSIRIPPPLRRARATRISTPVKTKSSWLPLFKKSCVSKLSQMCDAYFIKGRTTPL
ncbi:UNVERIFIED_CONTAM: hypothetical protein RMT77_011721 [Armadillidium vulgare]